MCSLKVAVQGNTDARISWSYWFKKVLYYQVALAYVLTRLIINVSQVSKLFLFLYSAFIFQLAKRNKNLGFAHYSWLLLVYGLLSFFLLGNNKFSELRDCMFGEWKSHKFKSPVFNWNPIFFPLPTPIFCFFNTW